jgi:hypothetical protein
MPSITPTTSDDKNNSKELTLTLEKKNLIVSIDFPVNCKLILSNV